MLLPALFAFAACRSQNTALAESRLSVDIDKGMLTVNGARMQFDAPLDEWKRVLGPSSRFVDRAGGLEVWDDLGLFVGMSYSHPKSDPHVRMIWFALQPASADMFPRKPFEGSVRVNGVSFSKMSKEAELHAAMPPARSLYEEKIGGSRCLHEVGYRLTEGTTPSLEAVFISGTCKSAAADSNRPTIHPDESSK
ncbi:hypothetical protein [Pendulispora albinea]|uniref:DUF7738 domain-containing protein n=1 Tax=Pendulispora albinea TaxID=2741071 RepID=A0ABZ2LLF5_9BACT